MKEDINNAVARALLERAKKADDAVKEIDVLCNEIMSLVEPCFNGEIIIGIDPKNGVIIGYSTEENGDKRFITVRNFAKLLKTKAKEMNL